jgi:hypothetical protein
MGLQSPVMTVLLTFRRIFSYLPKNQTTEFHAKILSVDKSNDGLQEFRPKEFSRGLFTITFTPLQFSESFGQKKFLFRDIEFSSKLDFCDVSIAGDYFLDIQYLDKRTFFLAEAFRIFEGH